MGMVNLPITLAQDKINSITNIIYDIRTVEQINPSQYTQDFIASTDVGALDNGAGFINTYKKDLLDVNERTLTGSPFDNYAVTNLQEGLVYDTDEYVAISEETLFENDADFTSAGEVSAFQAFNNKLLNDSLTFDMEAKLKTQFVKWTNDTVLSGITFSAADDKDQRITTTLQFAEWLRNRAVVYSNKNNSLTEVAGVTTAVSADRLTLYLDSTVMTYMQNILGNLYDPSFVKAQFGVFKIVEIPSNTGILPSTGSTFAWLCHDKKVSHMKRFRSAGILNPLTGLKNTFLHRRSGLGKFKTHAGESITLA